jgi:sarcosine oxidase subunit gamma
MSGAAAVTVEPVSGSALALLMARKGKADALCKHASTEFGVELSLQPRRIVAGSVSYIWAGPARWLVTSLGEAPSALEHRLRAAFAGLASVTNQSDGRSIIRISGVKARETLAKGVPIDLDPRAFRKGATALTTVGHINVQFWQVDDAPTYDFLVFRSYAVSFCEWVLAAGAEFGVVAATVNEERYRT